jgi:hypothetical protein
MTTTRRRPQNKKPTPRPQPSTTPGTVLHTNLVLLEVADPLLLEELRADRRFAPLLVAQLSDRAAVVQPGASEGLLRALLKAGHTPKVINP